MEPVKPRELIVAARVADGMVYVVGLAGVVAGAQLFREGEVSFAIVAWVLTFIAGAALRLVVWMARGIATVMDRSERIEEDLARLTRLSLEGPAGAEPDPDPYRPGRWGGWH
ncbi:MAG TPA: hypothetical protein VMM13_04510 [Euzebya sp.]|nr:hypothetical protein [Euzebya sp.]